jgi:pimeloyl-ACP methyl ester carboxylesterase
MKYLARSIRAVLDDARIDRAVLIGHAAGTPVIRQFDRMFPWRTRALVSVDGALRNPAPAAVAEKAVAAMRAADYREAIERNFDAMTPVASAEVRAGVKRSAAALPQHVAVSFTAAMFDPAIWKDDRIVVPLLVINQHSPTWSDDYVQAVRASSDDIDYQTMDGVDHFLMLEKPGEFNDRLKKWLLKKKLMR